MSKEAFPVTIPLWSLLGFAVWTLLLLFSTVGWYRWSRILTGREAISSFRADQAQGTPAYQRAMRAHANCVENLPVFGAIVLIAQVAGVSSPTLDVFAVIVLAARVVHSLIHVGFEQTNAVTSMRFAFFLTQIVAMFGMSAIIVRHALA
jgi:uncharacterized MAPEG superfamily protein